MGEWTLVKMDINNWLDYSDEEDIPSDAPLHVRRAIEREQERNMVLSKLWNEVDNHTEAENRFERWLIMYIADNWDLVLDMLTMLAMDCVYGRNQEERIATFLTIRIYAHGLDTVPELGLYRTEQVYCKLDTLLSRCRTYVFPKDVFPKKDEEDYEEGVCS